MRAFLLLMILPSLAAAKCKTPSGPLADANQLVLVVGADWNATTGALQRFQRSGKCFAPVGKPVAVVLGKHGMAWGRGLHGGAPRPPVKQEGDQKSPVGVFKLSGSFGYAATAKWKLPYHPLTTAIECVDDPASEHYNALVDKTQQKPDWNSSEHMLRADALYRVGVLVDHNADHPVANAGSCIFLHVWSGPDGATVGCTAMDGGKLEEILSWLDPRKDPVLVQIPVAERAKMRSEWGLP
jgi:D-alanyl-D-alanine dipeptidase